MAMQRNVSCRFNIAARTSTRVTRSPLVVQANLLKSFLSLGGGGGGAAAPKSAKAKELVSELISLARTTKAGTSASPATRLEIEKLAQELKAYSAKNSSKSPLLAGDYEVVYVSDPAAPGAPFEGPSGTIPFSGKLPTQSISPSGEVTNQVATKSFGIVEGFTRQYGSLKAVAPDAYQVELTKAEIKGGLGPMEVLSLEATLNVEILYLGDNLRIVSNSVESEEDSSTIIVYKRTGVEEEVEEEETSPAAKGAKSGTLFSTPKKEGVATISERQVRRQLEADKAASPSVTVASSGTSILKRLSGTQVVGGIQSRSAAPPGTQGTQKLDPKAAAAERAKAAEAVKAARLKEADDRKAEAIRQKEEREKEASRIKAEREKEAEKKAAEAKAARERAEAERKAAAEKQAEIKQLLADLAEDVKKAQAEGREAVNELKNIERTSAAQLKEVDATKRRIAAAEAESADAQRALEQAMDVKKDAEVAFNKAKLQLTTATTELKKAESAMIVTK